MFSLIICLAPVRLLPFFHALSDNVAARLFSSGGPLVCRSRHNLYLKRNEKVIRGAQCSAGLGQHENDQENENGGKLSRLVVPGIRLHKGRVADNN